MQIAKHERRQRRIKRIQDRHRGVSMANESLSRKAHKRRKITHSTRGANSTTLKVSFTEDEPLPPSAIEDPYHISKDQRLHVNLTALVRSNRDDPAFKVRNFNFSLCYYFADLKYFRSLITTSRVIFFQN